jgi:eukaryotic-like serine/threonine-protein kinase
MRSQSAARVQRLGDYELVRKLATGGMAEVYEARRLGPHGFAKRFAVKRILPQLATDPRLVEMFCDEARIHAGLSHPNLVQVVDFGEHEGELFMTLEYVDGMSCAELMMRIAARRRTVELEAALNVGREVLQGLAYAHAATDEQGRPYRLVHRDVAPSNILIGSSGEVKLGDFGIVRAALIESRTAPGEIKGKIGYVSPEQAMGLALDARSDLFSLAVVISEMLIGRALFPGQSEFEILTALHSGDVSALDIYGRHVPDDVRNMLRRALAKQPEDRFANAEEFLAEIEAAAQRHQLELGAHTFAEWLKDLGLIAVQSATRGFLPEPPAGRLTIADCPDGLRERSSDPPFADEITLSANELAGPDSERPHRTHPGVAPANDLDSVPPELAHAAVRARKLHPRRRSGKHELPRERSELDVAYRMRRLGGTIVGPLGLATMLELIATGRIGPDVELSRNSGPFVPVSSMVELARLAARAAYRFHEPLGLRASDRFLVDRLTLPAKLFALAHERRTGLLAARNGRQRKRLFFVDGACVSGASTDPDELIGARLVAAGILGREEVEGALEAGWRRGQRLGETLIEHRWLRPSELVRAMGEQRRARLLSLCRWTKGEIAFVDGAETGDDSAPGSGSSLALLSSVVLEAYAGEDLGQMLGPVWAAPLERVSGAEAIERALALPPPEEAALARAGRGHSLAELVGLERRFGLPDAGAIERAVFIGLSAGVLWSSAWRRST